MAEDELDRILITVWSRAYNNGVAGVTKNSDENPDIALPEALAAINAYTTNKIREARIDELGNFKGMIKHDMHDYIKRRIKELALNHRKDEDGASE